LSHAAALGQSSAFAKARTASRIILWSSLSIKIGLQPGIDGCKKLRFL
jgi:hypothetical protein